MKRQKAGSCSSGVETLMFGVHCDQLRLLILSSLGSEPTSATPRSRKCRTVDRAEDFKLSTDKFPKGGPLQLRA
jgi:hypothetical protein